MLMRNHSSNETGNWRPPLSDEDMEDTAPPPLPQSPSGILAVGGAGIVGGGVLAASHGHGSSSEDLGGNASVSGHGHSSTYSHSHSQYGSTVDVARQPSVARQNSNKMPGFGQAAEHMGAVEYPALPPKTPTSPLFSTSPSVSPIVPPSSKGISPPSAYMMHSPTYASSSSHGHSSSSDGHGTMVPGAGSGPSLQHTNTMMSNNSSSGSHSHSLPPSNTSHTPIPPPPRVRIHESSPRNTISGKSVQRMQSRDSSASFRGLISRLRGGQRTSSQDLSVSSPIGRRDTLTTTTASSSFHYPPTSTVGPSSLLNPPLPPPVSIPRSEEPWGEQQLPLPSPVPTEESSVRITEGLLDPHLVAGSRLGHELDEDEAEANYARMLRELGTTPSVGSLRDNVDYSRPYRGFVFNRMGSSVTFATQDTRTPVLETPASLATELTIDEGRETEYFGIAR
ncbi:hypothetical protein AAF712_007624 [Marasmius tenuissimus]|uniref:Uncharacterized protein n=1 Tax=Marasmius tenuissimus TaxID=585030 RepID=A0ABR2ZUQ0_9AGAR